MQGSQTVRKRLVFYCPGYDPEAETRYRRLFVIGLAQTARRFGIKREISPVESDETVPAQRWSVTMAKAGWRTETKYEMLCWHDLVVRDVKRSWLYRFPLLLAALSEAVYDGMIPKIFRIDWQSGLLMLYPWAALITMLSAALGIGYGLASLVNLVFPLPFVARILLSVLTGAGLLTAVDRFLRRAFLYLMLDAWVFNWQHGTERRPDLEVRLDRFCDRVLEAVHGTDADEVLIFGHSIGAVLALEIAARVLARDPKFGLAGPAVALVTAGGELPFVVFFRKPERLRRDIARLAGDPSLLWVDYQAPQDPLNASGFDPVRHLSLDLGSRPRVNPVVRSPRFKDLLSPETYRRIRYNFFRVHFQFLMANEIIGEYDYFTITCGPVRLRDRIDNPVAALRAIYGSAQTLPAYLAESPAAEPVAAMDPEPRPA